LQNVCKELSSQLKDLKKVIPIIPFEKEDIKEINLEISSDSIFPVPDFPQKWPINDEYMKLKSEDWRVELKQAEPINKNIKIINVQLTNAASDFLLIEDIRIVSSESNLIFFENNSK